MLTLIRIGSFALLLAVISAALPSAFRPSLSGWIGAMIGFWISGLFIDAYRRAQIVTSIVRAWDAAEGRARWQGSRTRLWLALFILGHAANAHGQSVSFERGEE